MCYSRTVLLQHDVSPASSSEPQLDLAFHRTVGGTYLRRRRVRYPYAVLSPLWLDQPAGDVATVIVHSLSGGIFEGERLDQRIVVATDGRACITNQGATIVHSMPGGGHAEHNVTLTLGCGAYLEYRPKPLVLFPGCRHRQSLSVNMGAGSSVVLCDGFFGHDPTARGQVFDQLDSMLGIRGQDGQLLVADRMLVSGDEAFDGAPGISHAVAAHGWMAALAPLSSSAAEELRAQIATEISGLKGLYAGVCTLRGGGVFLRVAGESAASAQQGLRLALIAARIQLLGSPPSTRLP